MCKRRRVGGLAAAAGGAGGGGIGRSRGRLLAAGGYFYLEKELVSTTKTLFKISIIVDGHHHHHHKNVLVGSLGMNLRRDLMDGTEKSPASGITMSDVNEGEGWGGEGGGGEVFCSPAAGRFCCPSFSTQVKKSDVSMLTSSSAAFSILFL